MLDSWGLLFLAALGACVGERFLYRRAEEAKKNLTSERAAGILESVSVAHLATRGQDSSS
jgi:hypothetical protein